MRTAISSIAYLRNLFPEDCFSEKKLTGLSIRTLLPTRPEAKLLLNWLEKGVFDALEKRYLSDVVFAIYTRCDPEPENILLECYQFHVEYHDEDSTTDAEENCTLQLTHTIHQDPTASAGNAGPAKMGTHNNEFGGTTTTNTDTTTTTARVFTKEEIRDSTVRLIRTLVTLTQTLKALPSKRFIAIKLQYRDEKTPPNYEPCFFKACTEEESDLVFHQQPYKVRVGEVQTRYHEITMKMRTIADTYVEPESAQQVPEGASEMGEVTVDQPGEMQSAEPTETSPCVQSAPADTSAMGTGEWILPCNGQDRSARVARNAQMMIPTHSDSRNDRVRQTQMESHDEQMEEMEAPAEMIRSEHSYPPSSLEVSDYESDTESVYSYARSEIRTDNGYRTRGCHLEQDTPGISDSSRGGMGFGRDSRDADVDDYGQKHRSRNYTRGRHENVAPVAISSTTPRTRCLTEELKARLHLKSAPTSQRNRALPIRHAPRVDYYSLTCFEPHVRSNIISPSERELFNNVAESIVQAGQVPRQQLIAEYGDEGLTQAVLRRFVGALEQRGILESVQSGRGSRLRVTDLANALAPTTENPAAADSTQYDDNYVDENTNCNRFNENAMSSSAQVGMPQESSRMLGNPRRLQRGSVPQENMAPQFGSPAFKPGAKKVVAGKISDPFDMSSLYADESAQNSPMVALHRSTRELFYGNNVTADSKPSIGARLAASACKTDHGAGDRFEAESVHSTTKRKGQLASRVVSSTSKTVSHQLQSRNVVEQEAAAARTRSSRKRVCVITSESQSEA